MWKRVPIGFERGRSPRRPPRRSRTGRSSALTQRDRRGFDLRKAPLMRFSLVEAPGRCPSLRVDLAPRDHRRLVAPHRAPRGASRSMTRSRRAGSSALERARPYADFIDWLEKQDPSRAEAFWRGYLGGFSSPTPLGVDHPARARRGALRRAVDRAVRRPTRAPSTPSRGGTSSP